MSDATKSILKIYGTLSPRQQRAFLQALAKHDVGEPKGPRVWNKWRVTFVSPGRLTGKDFMFMYARTAGEAIDFCNLVKHTKLVVTSIELIP